MRQVRVRFGGDRLLRRSFAEIILANACRNVVLNGRRMMVVVEHNWQRPAEVRIQVVAEAGHVYDGCTRGWPRENTS